MDNASVSSDKSQAAPACTSAFWFSENITPSLRLESGLNKITFDAQSDFQKVQIIETEPFGKILVLDGKTQSALVDEYIYHETLVHPALLRHPNPKTVYIGGGGEFATAREVLKHPSVTRVVMVDIDQVVCDMCREQMPEWNAGVFEDPRLEVHYTDAYAYLQNSTETFDVIIMDIADPIEAGPGYVLYTEEFYKYAVTKLSPEGVLVTQSGPGSCFNWDECFSAIHQTLKTAFNVVIPFTTDIPSFGSNWAFNLAFNSATPEACMAAVVEPSSRSTNEQIEKRIPGNLKFYDGISHLGLFGLSKQIRGGLEQEKRIITIDNPVFMY